MRHQIQLRSARQCSQRHGHYTMETWNNTAVSGIRNTQEQRHSTTEIRLCVYSRYIYVHLARMQRATALREEQ